MYIRTIRSSRPPGVIAVRQPWSGPGRIGADHGAETTSRNEVVRSEPHLQIEGHLTRVDLQTGEPQSVFTTAGTVDSGLQVVADGTPTVGRNIVNNRSFAYYLAAAFSYGDFTTIGNDMRVYGCSVSY